jgi:hypothetical protein
LTVFSSSAGLASVIKSCSISKASGPCGASHASYLVKVSSSGKRASQAGDAIPNRRTARIRIPLTGGTIFTLIRLISAPHSVDATLTGSLDRITCLARYAVCAGLRR